MKPTIIIKPIIKASGYFSLFVIALNLSACSQQQVASAAIATVKLPVKAAGAVAGAAGGIVGGAVGGAVGGGIGKAIGAGVGSAAGRAAIPKL
jgi:uncharacterized protein YcfJ